MYMCTNKYAITFELSCSLPFSRGLYAARSWSFHLALSALLTLALILSVYTYKKTDIEPHVGNMYLVYKYYQVPHPTRPNKTGPAALHFAQKLHLGLAEKNSPLFSCIFLHFE